MNLTTFTMTPPQEKKNPDRKGNILLSLLGLFISLTLMQMGVGGPSPFLNTKNQLDPCSSKQGEVGQLRGIVGRVDKPIGYGSMTSIVVTSSGCNLSIRGGFNELGLLVKPGERVSFQAVSLGMGEFSNPTRVKHDPLVLDSEGNIEELEKVELYIDKWPQVGPTKPGYISWYDGMKDTHLGITYNQALQLKIGGSRVNTLYYDSAHNIVRIEN